MTDQDGRITSFIDSERGKWIMADRENEDAWIEAERYVQLAETE